MSRAGIVEFIKTFPFPPRLKRIRVSRHDFIGILADIQCGYPVLPGRKLVSEIQFFDSRHGEIRIVQKEVNG